MTLDEMVLRTYGRTNGQTNGQTDNAISRVDFATENGPIACCYSRATVPIFLGHLVAGC